MSNTRIPILPATSIPILPATSIHILPATSIPILPATSTYMGIHGYTIFKECLCLSDHKKIKDDLNVRPFIPNSPVKNTPTYKIFGETVTTYTFPRYYGIQHYGVPDQNVLSPGVDIKVAFEGVLRDDQNFIVEQYVKAAYKHGGGLLEIPCGRGKTVDACKIISVIGKKTLVIVHKSFLLNQWIERIRQFLPTARIGKIQGQIIETDNKDIVIGMLQSLSMKEYLPNTFSSFGLTIVDECHHISSEVFCRSLQQIVTKYTLGLSATMNRKDGLTKVFKMFLGDIVYSEERPSTETVLVKAIHFISTDIEFNKDVNDFRGNPAYSTMISKLCVFEPRSKFILNVLVKEIREAKIDEPDMVQQIMILAHNKNLLSYLHDAIVSQNIATVGYYVGGMKESELKKSETKQVIIATYAMASEALDIKTLTTLILSTPKTDVIQAVGRILRVKHKRPMVVDIIDTHDIFESQWHKRKKYYMTNNYTILHTRSDVYHDNKWTKIEYGKRINKNIKNNINKNLDKNNNDDDSSEEIYPFNNLPQFNGKLLLSLTAD